MSYALRRPLNVDERNAMGVSSDLVAHLLFHRGLTDANSVQKFLSPDYDRDIHDPFLLKDAEKAAERILRAISNKEKIAIYADYDADGIPGATVWNDFFQRIGFTNFIIYIPHRHDEGFGVNIDAVEELASQKVNLIVTVDCGISDVVPIARAVELGMEVIVTDHHEPPAKLPPAFAIIDHKQEDCGYPDKNICGSGVAYKLIQAILKKNKELNNLDIKPGTEKWLLDMVGIATLSDMVPLMGENRIFAHYGMTVLRKSQRKGFVRLLKKLKIAQQHLTEDDIAFMITPRINAASRMGVPMDAFKLLSASTDEDADFYAEQLDAVNQERKTVVSTLVKEVKKTILERHGERVPSVIVLGNPAWRPSLLGLAANSCAEEFNRPVFLWGRDGADIIKGSCRSEGTSSVVEIMRGVPVGIFTHFGGHKFSGGFAVGNESIHFLDKHLVDAADKIRELAKIHSYPEESDFIDAELPLDAVTMQLNDEISRLAPFGTGNPKPIFLFKNVTPDAIKRFGKGSEHIEISFKKNNGMKIPAISFFGAASEWAKKIEPLMPVDLVASLEKSMFRGRPELRLRVVDVLSF